MEAQLCSGEAELTAQLGAMMEAEAASAALQTRLAKSEARVEELQSAGAMLEAFAEHEMEQMSTRHRDEQLAAAERHAAALDIEVQRRLELEARVQALSRANAGLEAAAAREHKSTCLATHVALEVITSTGEQLQSADKAHQRTWPPNFSEDYPTREWTGNAMRIHTA